MTPDREMRWFYKWESWNLEVNGSTFGYAARQLDGDWFACAGRILSRNPTLFGAMSALLRALGAR